MAQRVARWPLSRKILALGLLNLVLLLIALAIVAEWQFGLSVESLVLGPARDRILGIANAVGRELDSTPYEGRVDVLAQYSARYGADMFLIGPRGETLGGPEIDVPPAVLAKIRAHPASAGHPLDPLGRGPEARRPGGDLGPPSADGPGFPPPGRGAPGALPSNVTFLTITRNPLLYWICVRIPTNGPGGEKGIPGILLLRANTIFNSKLFFDWRALALFVAACTVIALACWWPFLKGITHSIREMDHATEAIAQGRFDHHVALQRQDELGHLGEQINRMAGRLESFVKNQKRFLGDIAHELCAPIARIQFALGILEQKMDQQSETHLALLHTEIQEMSGLVNELLLFSKAGVESGQAPLTRVELVSAVQRAVAHQLPGSGTIDVVVPAGLCVLAHEPYLVRAVSNLLRNALRYAGQHGPAEVTARREGDRVLLSVLDSGPGLPEGSHADVFAPFYRPEVDRARDTGGAGLGLAIVKSCIEACRGDVTCRNRQPSGLDVTISLAAWRPEASAK